MVINRLIAVGRGAKIEYSQMSRALLGLFAE